MLAFVLATFVGHSVLVYLYELAKNWGQNFEYNSVCRINTIVDKCNDFCKK